MQRSMMMTLLFAVAPNVAAFAVGGAPMNPLSAARCASGVEMKGKGTRGMPGKGATGPGTGGGFTNKSKKRMQQRDFERSEWTLVAEKGELGDEVGSTVAVEAGQSPQGQNYVWALVRGEAQADGGDDDEETNVYATDGACVACQFPMSKADVVKEDGLELLDCKTCGAQWKLKDGSVHKWLPGVGLGQMAMKMINKDKEPKNINLLPTRVSRAGRVYVRLPDGTLAITETAADRAAELSGQSPMEAVAAAQEKAKSLKKE